MILHPSPHVHATRAHWDSATRHFLLDASDIGPLGRVYDNACDVGLTLVSQYGGRGQVVMVVNHEQRDGDGDLLYQDLVPADGRSRDFGVRIYND